MGGIGIEEDCGRRSRISCSVLILPQPSHSFEEETKVPCLLTWKFYSPTIYTCWLIGDQTRRRCTLNILRVSLFFSSPISRRCPGMGSRFQTDLPRSGTGMNENSLVATELPLQCASLGEASWVSPKSCSQVLLVPYIDQYVILDYFPFSSILCNGQGYSLEASCATGSWGQKNGKSLDFVYNFSLSIKCWKFDIRSLAFLCRKIAMWSIWIFHDFLKYIIPHKLL